MTQGQEFIIFYDGYLDLSANVFIGYVVLCPIWPLNEMFISLLKHLTTKASVLFSKSAAMAHDSQTCRNMEMTRERISFTFDPRNKLLSIQTGFSFVTEQRLVQSLREPPAEVFEPCFGTQLLPFNVIFVLMPLVLFDIILVLSPLISILYIVQICRDFQLEVKVPVLPQLEHLCHRKNAVMVKFLPPVLFYHGRPVREKC